ncbi:peptide chain release factor N(5)-glutamine methyltransferase [Ornithinibacillus sp. BX22]|uniref:Release factor glutamine methyltransferase n=2 Tax=Ornithinibacillus TaxID=484508 RepID=A0A923L3D9_9BACI|nr:MULTISPECIES: peptide chain release factor N(5)-glutamine methyltransferase [Ornithinibacillus]MBC5635620.1 peptide chain release factor N(5)-glutamine methyltransferase [Ornithinibacillus hominis]MBS3679231.1 peptide chain release factor N(5)-glutamine methyltransferase [Ornithinibacillus massiliensis]
MAQKQYEVLEWASLFLEKSNRETRVAELLLQHHLNVSRTQYFAQMREDIPQHIVEKFRADIVKHAETGVPIQHLMGYEIFYGRKYSVNEDVLIPRPETEELVLHVIAHAPKDKPITIVDVGTGSGIIAITLALELPNADVYAIDISPDALVMAKKNAEDLEANVTFLQGDFLEPFVKQDLRADIIVSNPPYIAEEERSELSDTVVNYDPEIALFAEDNGLFAYKKIISQLPAAILSGGSVAFEIGHLQGKAVQELLQQTFPESSVTVRKDINGKDRIVSAKII